MAGWWRCAVLLLAGWCAMLPAWAALPALAPPLALAPGAAHVPAELPGALVPRGLHPAGASRLALRPVQAGGLVAFDRDNELWLALNLRNPSGSEVGWQVQVTLPQVDEVTLFERSGDAWREASAGDRVPQADWPRPGRFPRFDVRLGPQEDRVVYLRVRNAYAASVPLRLLGEVEADAAEASFQAGFGFVLGMLALLVAACAMQSALYRDGAYFLYAAYALLLGAAFAAVSGWSGQHLWRHSPDASDVTKTVLPVAAAGFSVWLVRALCNVELRERWLSRLAALSGALVVSIAFALALLRQPVPGATATAMGLAAGTVLVLGLRTWWRGDPMGGWVLGAHLPLIAVTALVVLRMLGVAPFEFDVVPLLGMAIGAILALLLGALYVRSREHLAVQSRAREAPSIDPLTGLLSQQLFAQRLRAAVARYRRSQHDAAVLYIRMANHARIRELHGNTVAEQSMIRAAMKLRRLMPEADSMGRVGDSTMGMIVETVTARAILQERAARLVAHGLMPLRGLKPEVTLNFQVVGHILSDAPLEAADLQEQLDNVLAGMSPRTRRPIRFLGAAATAETDEGEEAPGLDEAATPAGHGSKSSLKQS